MRRRDLGWGPLEYVQEGIFRRVASGRNRRDASFTESVIYRQDFVTSAPFNVLPVKFTESCTCPYIAHAIAYSVFLPALWCASHTPRLLRMPRSAWGRWLCSSGMSKSCSCPYTVHAIQWCSYLLFDALRILLNGLLYYDVEISSPMCVYCACYTSVFLPALWCASHTRKWATVLRSARPQCSSGMSKSQRVQNALCSPWHTSQFPSTVVLY